MRGKAGSVDFILTTNCDILIGFPTFFPTFLALEVSENGIIIVLRPPIHQNMYAVCLYQSPYKEMPASYLLVDDELQGEPGEKTFSEDTAVVFGVVLKILPK